MTTDTAPTVHNISEPLLALASPVANLTPLPGNPRRGDVAAITRSLRVFGQRKPVTARKTGEDEHGDPVGYVTAGNHTLLAARDELAWTHVAVAWFDEDETTGNAWALADNRTAELGDTDADDLVAMLEGITDRTMFAATAYTDADLEALLDDGLPPPGDAEVVEFPVQWGVIVTVDDEHAQAALLKRMQDEGFTVRAIL